MKKLLPIFNLNMDVYDYKYSYNHLKVVACIESSKSANRLEDYEDVAIVAEAIVNYWSDGRDDSEYELYAQNEWLEIETGEENGYVQAYANRVADKFVDAYLEVKNEAK